MDELERQATLAIRYKMLAENTKRSLIQLSNHIDDTYAYCMNELSNSVLKIVVNMALEIGKIEEECK
jgi:6-phosphogluconolactonase (cycloisomerase 2 family)